MAGTRPNEFPVGGGELGALIRAFDWSKTSLGPISAWPQSLKTATDIVLQSPLPMVMLWGRDGVMIYNDAYSVFAGQRHPRLLGSKVLEGWAEVADFNARVMEVGLAGGTLSFKDQELILYRNDVAEPVWMDLNYGPVFDESGRPGGVLAIVVETTARVQAERRQAFLFEFGERLRELVDPREIAGYVSTAIGTHLRVDRAGWAEIDQETGSALVHADWSSPGTASLAGRHDLAAFGPARIAALAAARTVHTEDVLTDPMTAGDAVQANFAALGVRALMTAPILRGGVLRGALLLHSREPRRWTDDEEALLREVAERTWNVLDRARAEARVRDSEARLRALVNATSDVIFRVNADWTQMRRLDGRGVLPAVESALVDWLGQYLLPEDHPEVLAAIERAVRRKGVFQLEHRVRRADGGVGWMFSRAVPLLDEQGEIVEWFGAATDVTGRRQAEEHQRLLVNELNHRVKNNLAMAQAIGTQTFRNADDLAAAQKSFTARIIALAKANDLLTEERWVDASLQDVVETAVRPHCGGERVLIEGPPLRLSAKTAMSLAMAFHELATNAVKHGAWSTPEGRVEIRWRMTHEPAGDRLHLEWREADGPPVSPPRRRGFGSRLIERGLSAELGGEVRLRFEPDGLVCETTAPLKSAAEG